MTASRPVFVALAGLALVAAASRAAPGVLLVNESPSLREGVYLRAPGAAAERGAVVALAPPPAARAYLDGLGAPPEARLLKRIAGLGGDRVCAVDGGLVLEGRLHRVRRLDRRGARLPQWSGCGRLPAGQVFLLGDSEESFDSRYFGPVAAGRLLGVYREVWTW